MLLQIAYIFMNILVCIHCIYKRTQYILNQLSGDGHLITLNNVSVTLGCTYVFQLRVFIFSRYITGSGIAGSYGNSFFRLFKNII